MSPVLLWVSKFDVKLESWDLIFKILVRKFIFEKFGRLFKDINENRLLLNCSKNFMQCWGVRELGCDAHWWPQATGGSRLVLRVLWQVLHLLWLVFHVLYLSVFDLVLTLPPGSSAASTRRAGSASLVDKVACVRVDGT